MKCWIASLTAAILGLSLASSCLAAPAAGAAPAKPAQKGAKGPRAGGGGYRRFEAALAKLNLSADQKTKVNKLVTEAKAEARKIRQGAGTREEKRAKGREVMKNFRQRLNAILTPAQQAQLREAMPKRGKGPRAANSASAKPKQ